MIEINIRKRIRTYNELDYIQVKTSFMPRAVTQITGPSGAGKTTLLKVIAGLVHPEEGTLSVNGEVWFDRAKGINFRPRERKTGMVFQDYALFPHMTLRQHLLYGTRDEEYIERLIEIGQLGKFCKHKPRHLSGGQQQRLAILRALSTKPKLLLMDEPFSALNSSLIEDVMRDLKTLFNELQLTCLIVSHQQRITEAFSDFTFSLDTPGE